MMRVQPETAASVSPAVVLPPGLLLKGGKGGPEGGGRRGELIVLLQHLLKHLETAKLRNINNRLFVRR